MIHSNEGLRTSALKTVKGQIYIINSGDNKNLVTSNKLIKDELPPRKI